MQRREFDRNAVKKRRVTVIGSAHVLHHSDPLSRVNSVPAFSSFSNKMFQNNVLEQVIESDVQCQQLADEIQKLEETRDSKFLFYCLNG